MATVKISLKYDKLTLKAMIAYIKTLLSQKFPLEIKRRFENQNSLDILEEKAKEIVERLIYDAWPDPGNRTFNLLNSVVAVAGSRSSKTAQINLLSDPDVAPSKYDPTLSYMAFFEKPEEYNTFIKPRGIAAKPDNYRPFFDTWTKMVQRHSEKLARESIDTALDNLMPNILRTGVSVP